MGRVCHNIVLCIDIIQYFLGLLGKVTFVWIKSDKYLNADIASNKIPLDGLIFTEYSLFLVSV